MRLEGIDFLRGFAVSTVIIYHFFVLLNLMGDPLFPYIHFFGQFGVSLFFVISGYLIYRSIDFTLSQKNIKNGITSYTLHRLFRILPAYYMNLFIVILIFGLLQGFDYILSSAFIKPLFSHLTFSSYFIYKDAGFGINGAYWTLNIEMLWYILVPILFIFIKKNRYLILLFILSFIYLLGIDLSWYDSLLQLDKNASNYTLLLYYLSFQLPGQLIYFIMGIFIYKYSKPLVPIPLLFRYIITSLIFILFIYLSIGTYLLTNFTLRNLFLLTIVSFIFILLYNQKHTYLKSIEWLGKISYSLYLWHMPILILIKKYLFPLNISLGSISLIFIISLIGISSLSYYYIEENGFKLRKKFENNS